MKGCASGLRYELCARNASYAAESQLPHALSSGQQAVVVYQSSDDRRHHGNFIDASYRAILKRPEWRRRLQKVHSHGNQSLPKSEWVWRELDSSMSSDALLMNIFCYPGVTKRREVSLLLGTEPEEIPQFGFMPRVPLVTGAVERTEVDMKLGDVLFEAKLTEGDFQIQDARIVDQYRDLKEVFECRKLPRQRQALCLLSTLAECARGPRSRSQFLCFARCPPAGLARTVVQGDAVHTVHNPSHPMQGAHLAGTCGLPAIGTAPVSVRKIRDHWKPG